MQNLPEKLSETLQWSTRKNNHFTFGMKASIKTGCFRLAPQTFGPLTSSNSSSFHFYLTLAIQWIAWFVLSTFVLQVDSNFPGG